MAKQTNQYALTGYRNAAAVFQNADGVTSKNIIAAGANDSIISSMSVVSTDAAANTLLLILNDGTTDYVINSFAIPALAGTQASPRPVDLLTDSWLPLSLGKRVLTLQGGWYVKAQMQNAVSAACKVTVVAMAQDY